ncbi:MAG: iron-containing alcohol dehydrogenase [Syntrophaceticus sp.]|nr:iron-containing alcohol dehydrogenase [Syntrophaceticus sp.]
MLFDFLVPQIIFGPGCVWRLGAEASIFGKKLLLCMGKGSLQASGMIERVISPLEAAGLEIVYYGGIAPEPTIERVEESLKISREYEVDMVIGVGGGSVLDVAKAAAGLYYEDSKVKEYFEGREPEQRVLPWIAVPTTAGSGAEVTKNAVLRDLDTGKKQSIRWDWWQASIALVDPVLTMTMPRQITAQSGMDALTHALEAYTSRWATPMTDGLAIEAVVLICRNLYSAYSKGRDKDARQQVSLGSLMAGIALNNARAGLVHALAHPLGVSYHLAHGLVCAVLLPQVMEFNMIAVAEKYARVAKELHLAEVDAGSADAAERLVHFVRMLQKRLQIPAKLGEVGLQEEDIPGLAEAALPSGSLAANPRKAMYADLVNILEANL